MSATSTRTDGAAPAALRAGLEIKCWRCVAWHVLEPSATPGPYERQMLFIRCGDGNLYYAGNEGLPSTRALRVVTVDGQSL